MAASQTTDGKPHLACLSLRPFTDVAMEDLLARPTALPLILVSDGLSCFKVDSSTGAAHDRHVTSGGKASVLSEKFRGVITLVGTVKTALTGTYHSVKFANCVYRPPC